jgi:hypothetical protein
MSVHGLHYFYNSVIIEIKNKMRAVWVDEATVGTHLRRVHPYAMSSGLADDGEAAVS